MSSGVPYSFPLERFDFLDGFLFQVKVDRSCREECYGQVFSVVSFHQHRKQKSGDFDSYVTHTTSPSLLLVTSLYVSFHFPLRVGLWGGTTQEVFLTASGVQDRSEVGGTVGVTMYHRLTDGCTRSGVLFETLIPVYSSQGREAHSEN